MSKEVAVVSFTEGDEQRMMLMWLKRFTKYQNQPNVIALRNQIAAEVEEHGQYRFDG